MTDIIVTPEGGSMFWFALLLVTALVTAPQNPPAAQAQEALTEELWEAARQGDVARVRAALDKGVDVNAKARYDRTALTFAADKGHTDVIRLLLDRGADINVQDTFYKMRAVDMALMNEHLAAARLLLERGSRGAAAALNAAVQHDDPALAKAALQSDELTRGNLTGALAAAQRTKRADLEAMISARLKSLPPPETPAVTVDRATLESYAGPYRNEQGMVITVALSDNQLTVTAPGSPPLTLLPTSTTAFRAAEFDGITFTFAGRGGTIERLLLNQGGGNMPFERVSSAAAAAPAEAVKPAGADRPDAEALKPAPRRAPRPWPGFRGENASGNGDGQGAVAEWNLETGLNVRWKTPLPGISTASPVVAGNRVFVVSAISSSGDATFRTGLYGDVKPVDDLSEHTWKIYALDKASGKVLWEHTAHTGVPKVKRHTKSSQANSTPVTDGKHVVAVFGSIGLLAAWGVDGKPLWRRDIGVVDSGWFFDPEVQWGHSSSPIIYNDTVILQVDQYKGSYIAAYALDSGKEVWRTERRDEISTWGTPTVFRAGDRDQVVTNGTTVRGYDAATGQELWTLGPNSEITVGTPVVGNGLVYVTGGYPPVRPIYAIKPTASGAMTVKGDETPDALAWANEREGTYIPTPLFYDGILYTFANNGIVTAYDGASGERLYRARVGGGGSFAASPIAADGRLYFANEDGQVIVAKAGRTYAELVTNEMKEVIMATPAISDGIMVVRTLGHVYGIGEK
jgi:outer membrane protein assembly factor BamB